MVKNNFKMDQNFLNLLPEELKNIATDLYDIVLKRSLMRGYENLSEEDKAKMTEIFNSGTEEEKIDFLKTHFSDLQRYIIEETQKLMTELKKD
jgi:hypothetical protein